jgi:hypothetical protein
VPLHAQPHRQVPTEPKGERGVHTLEAIVVSSRENEPNAEADGAKSRAGASEESIDLEKPFSYAPRADAQLGALEKPEAGGVTEHGLDSLVVGGELPWNRRFQELGRRVRGIGIVCGRVGRQPQDREQREGRDGAWAAASGS